MSSQKKSKKAPLTIVHLRTYKTEGTRSGIHKDEAGNILNENQLVKLPYGSLEWNNYLKHIRIGRNTKVTVANAFEALEDGGYKNSSSTAIEKINREVQEAFNPSGSNDDANGTPEQKMINKLAAKIEALEKKGGGNANEIEAANIATAQALTDANEAIENQNKVNERIKELEAELAKKSK
jgi:hypothetical protein